LGRAAHNDRSTGGPTDRPAVGPCVSPIELRLPGDESPASPASWCQCVSALDMREADLLQAGYNPEYNHTG